MAKKARMADYACYGPLLLRLGIGFVFVYAGLMKLFFEATLPVELVITFLPADISLFILAMVEFIIGSMLILGYGTKYAGWGASGLFVLFFVGALYLHVSGAMPDLWFTMGMFKDIALLGAALYLALSDASYCSVDTWLAEQKN